MKRGDDSKSPEPDSDPDDWKEYDKYSIPMSAFYKAQQEILQGIFFSPNRVARLDSLLLDFKPNNYSKKEWFHLCYNNGIDTWVNSDSVFRKINNQKELSPLEKIANSYRAMIDVAMNEGIWKKDYSMLLSKYIPDNNDSEDDGN